jgi:multiple sugar transport system substrate-binding protein
VTALRPISIIAVAFTLCLLSGCSPQSSVPQKGRVALVLKLGKIFGDPEPLRRLLDRFEKENPGVRVRDEALPSSSDEQQQFYATNLEAGSSDFDVFSLDVIWVPAFARAGWLREVGHLLSAAEKEDFFPGPMKAVQYQNRWYAIPWYVDAGLLYCRKDLLAKYGFSPPRTWPELVRTAQSVLSREKGIYGFLWQGKQYEGLVCNALEYTASNGGKILRDGKVAVDSPENREALEFMRDLISKYRVSPPLVTSMVEETARNVFGNGSALFMRNWPYAWQLLQKEGSPVAGKIAAAPLPSFPGGKSSPTLGGWQLGVNRHSRHPREAEKLLAFLSSAASQKFLAVSAGVQPARRSLYRDHELAEAHPFLPRLYGSFMEASPRTVTPYYMMITHVLQAEFSAIINGIKPAGEALGSARKQMEHILGGE